MRSTAEIALRSAASLLSVGGARGRLSILIYHRVLASDDPLNNDLTAAQFERHMRTLSQCFAPLPLAEAVERLRSSSLPARAVSVTFDDGYLDNVQVALPILQRHGIHATFFVATGYLDGGCMWNDRVLEAIRAYDEPELDLHAWGLGALPLSSDAQRRAAVKALLAALKHLPGDEREAKAIELEARAGGTTPTNLMMRETDVRALHGAGMGIGAHTVSHPILARLAEDRAEREIVDSRDRLSAIVREPVALFAYPNGKPGQDYGNEHVRIVRRAGFRAAVSTAHGAASGRADLYQLPRFTPWHREPLKFGLALLASRRDTRPSAV